MLPLRIKTTDVATVRERQRLAQGHRCAICQLPMTAAEACLDHCHSTSNVRGTLHRGCNALLGKVENNAARYGVRNIAAFANGIAAYLQLHSTNITGYLHPTFKTEEQKRVARNTKARKTRAANKAT